MRRAVISIPSNIAEGSCKNTKEYVRFLRIALGSAYEIETQSIIAKELYPSLHYKEFDKTLEEILKMLHTLISKLNHF